MLTDLSKIPQYNRTEKPRIRSRVVSFGQTNRQIHLMYFSQFLRAHLKSKQKQRAMKVAHVNSVHSHFTVHSF